MTKLTTARKKSSKHIVAGATASTAVLAAHSVIPGMVLAANQYDWIRQTGIDLEGSAELSVTAMSASGTHLMASGGESNPGLHISVNAGASWQNIAEEIDPGNTHIWTAVDVSNNGQTMVAASEDYYDTVAESLLEGRIFISTNAGVSWSDVTPADSDDWSDVVVSGDGSAVAAVMQGDGSVYVSENNGTDWTTSQFDENSWSGKNIAISDNGEKILVGGENSNNPYTHLYISTNGGDTWSDIDPDVEDGIWDMSPEISADGGTIAVATTGYADSENDSIFISSNNGADWTDITPEDPAINEWEDLSMSDDGSTITAVDDRENKLYVSSDAGQNWNEENPDEAYEADDYWKAADLNSNGSKIIAVSTEAAYLNFVSPADEPSVTLGNAENGKTIIITTPEGTTITCSSAAKESGLDAQDGNYAYPLGLVDFCFSGADANNPVALLFVTDLKPDDVLVRKYNPETKAYSTIDDVDVTETTYEGNAALLVSYNITDNGPLDLDPDIGEIADPVGIAIAETTLADTGDSSSLTALMAISLLTVGLSLVVRQQKR